MSIFERPKPSGKHYFANAIKKFDGVGLSGVHSSSKMEPHGAKSAEAW
jgi:hypothetical protein